MLLARNYKAGGHRPPLQRKPRNYRQELRDTTLEIKNQSRGEAASSRKTEWLSEQRRREDAADCADLSVVQQISDGKIPCDPRTRKIDTADLNRATLTASDLGSADIARRNAGSRFRFNRLNLRPRHINVVGVWRRQCVPGNPGRAIGKTLVAIVVPSSRQWLSRRDQTGQV